MSVIAASGQWLLLAAAVIADLALVRFVAGRTVFRRLIAEVDAADERRAQEHERAMLRMAMSPHHAQELERLEVIVGSLYRRLGTGAGAGADSLIDELGPDRLLATYASLAIAHCRGEALLEMSPPPHHREQPDPALEALRSRRGETRERARAQLVEIAQQLDALADLIVTMHEQAAIDSPLIAEARRRIADATCAVDAVADMARWSSAGPALAAAS